MRGQPRESWRLLGSALVAAARVRLKPEQGGRAARVRAAQPQDTTSAHGDIRPRSLASARDSLLEASLGGHDAILPPCAVPLGMPEDERRVQLARVPLTEDARDLGSGRVRLGCHDDPAGGKIELVA